MKNRTLLFLGLMASAFFYSCDKDENKDDKDDDEFCFVYKGQPKETISYSQAKKLQQEYISTRANVLTEVLINNGTLGDNEEDVRDVSFDLTTLKNYIAYVEKKAQEKGITPDNLELRVYLGSYPKDYTADGFDKNDQGKSTMFFLPVNKLKSKPASKTASKTNMPSDKLEGVDGLNFGGSGKPPRDLN